MPSNRTPRCEVCGSRHYCAGQPVFGGACGLAPLRSDADRADACLFPDSRMEDVLEAITKELSEVRAEERALACELIRWSMVRAGLATGRASTGSGARQCE